MRPSLAIALAVASLLAIASEALAVHRQLARGHAVAATISLGWGLGVTLRGPLYHELHALERESVEVHEAVHRRQTTWSWPPLARAQEREAYAEQLAHDRARRAELLERGDLAGAIVLWRWEREMATWERDYR